MLRREGRMIALGRFKLHQLSDGVFRLDGGAMFGVVPKILWNRASPADEHNRIALNLGCLLIQTPTGKNVLVDTGLSSKYDRNKKFLDLYSVRRSPTLRDQLKNLGLTPNDIHLVINTHLHFDHAGGDTELIDGKPAPQFPRAKYIVQKEEWEDANSAHERNKASYLPENYAPLEEAKALEFVSGEFEIEPGLKVIRSGGHTRGHQCVLVESEGRTAIFFGDLVPTRAHMPLPYIMGYDLYPVDTLEAKRDLLGRAKEQAWLLLFQHDPEQRAGYLAQADGRMIVVPPEAFTPPRA
ncbi:MAG: MBL fold metallo-hydrolase [Elusimicrobia bacterium]|nr:MBL fold metallo-hydrolase [Elusimicrobiota bacterium]